METSLKIRAARNVSFRKYKNLAVNGETVENLIEFIKAEAPQLDLNFTQYQRAYWAYLIELEAPSLDHL